MAFTEDDARAFIEANKHHIDRLRRAAANLATIQQVAYYHQRFLDIINDSKVFVENDLALEAEAYVTTVVISYGRLFSESKGVSVFKRKTVPKHLLPFHDEIISLRNERYAHHGDHTTTAAELGLCVFEEYVDVEIHWKSALVVEGAKQWTELFNWFKDFLNASIAKQLKFLSATSGKDWPPTLSEMTLNEIEVV